MIMTNPNMCNARALDLAIQARAIPPSSWGSAPPVTTGNQ